ncbi:MAG: cytochrome b N-terminal domain-containing protein [Deltaproteobacteria bacterium]|nr:cytochrome b N-terminal domain-containing protein [Deltaproteobacteria bacterium]
MKSALLRLEDLLNKVFTPRYNPLYHLGAIAVFFMWVLLASGLYLFIFYKIGLPYESVSAITERQFHIGNIFRGVHRYAGDAMILFTILHLVREFIKGRFRHSRWLPWASGGVTLLVIWVTGVIGYWMVWDERSQLIAELSSKLLDYLPIFGESLSMAFTTSNLITNLFFFIALFLHLTLPILLLILLWLHVMRVSKPCIHPPRLTAAAVAAALIMLSIARPVTMAAAANAGRVVSSTGIDWFFLSFYPVLNAAPAWAAWAILVPCAAILILTPWIPPLKRPPAAQIIRDNCTGCGQCYEDCPYAAIFMKQRKDGSPYESEAVVIPGRCASCGICVGSCDFDAVGFPLSIDRGVIKGLIGEIKEEEGPPVICIMCSRVEGRDKIAGIPGVRVLTLPCTGMTRPSWIENALDEGAAGVLIRGCETGDCHNRTGNKWIYGRTSGSRQPLLRNDARPKALLYLTSNASREDLLEAVRKLRGDVKPGNLPEASL